MKERVKDIDFKSADHVVQEIRDMNVKGGSPFGRAAAWAFKLATQKEKLNTKKELRARYKDLKKQMLALKPTMGTIHNSCNIVEEVYEENKNEDLKVIKEKVIKVALDEINEKSDITVEYAYYKDGGRAHVGVDFTFYKKAKDTVKPISEHPVKRRPLSDEEQAMLERLTNPERWNISEDVARKFIKKHTLGMLDANIIYAWKYKKGKENLGGWLISCIKKDCAGEEAKRKAQRKEEEKRQHTKAQEAADIAAAGMFPEKGIAAKMIDEKYKAEKEQEIKSDGKLPEVIVNMILKAGSADKIIGLAKRELEKRGLTYEAVLAGAR